MRRVIAAVAVGAAAFGLGTVASSASDPTNDVIHACKNDDHSVRIVAATDSCRSGEQPLAWNATGPQGIAGPAGPTGPAGPSALSYQKVVFTAPATFPNPGDQFSVTATCPAGFFVTGGFVKGVIPAPAQGAWDGIAQDDRYGNAGQPTADGTGWTGLVSYNTSGYSFSAQATAYCVGPGGA